MPSQLSTIRFITMTRIPVFQLLIVDTDISELSNLLKPTPKGHLAVTNSNFWLSFGRTYYDNRLLPGWRSMVVAWHTASRSLMIREENDVDDGIPPISYTFKDEQEMLSTFGDSKEVYFGFTGSTGSLAQTNALMIRNANSNQKSRSNNSKCHAKFICWYGCDCAAWG